DVGEGPHPRRLREARGHQHRPARPLPGGDRQVRAARLHAGAWRQGLRDLCSGADLRVPRLPDQGERRALHPGLALPHEPRHLHDARRRGGMDALDRPRAGAHRPLRRRLRGLRFGRLRGLGGRLAGQMKKHVLILGAGFAGLELSSRLAESVADEVRVTLIDQKDGFIFGFSKLDLMFGRKPRSEVQLDYRDLSKPGVEFRQEAITSIDPESKQVSTDASSYEADVLVVALGADYD